MALQTKIISGASYSAMKSPRILLTGATGFIGQALTSELLRQGCKVVAALRRFSSRLPDEVEQYEVGDILPTTDWSASLQGVDVVVHMAARAHILKETMIEPIEEFRKVNTEGTLALAQQASAAGVKRYIFISSIGVNGSSTIRPFLETDTPSPGEPYAISKFEAEQGLMDLAKETGMEVVIIRPPLVYGPKAPGNFGRLMYVLNKGIPLPLGAINNKRSLVALDNLVSFIIHCIDHPKAVNEVFLISDGEDVSTTELLQKISMALGKSSRLIPVPVGIMKFVAGLIGKKSLTDRLFSSLQLDSSKARNLLGWKPVVTMGAALKKTVDAHLEDN